MSHREPVIDGQRKSVGIDRDNGHREIPVGPLAEEVLRVMSRRGYTWADVCRQLGMTRRAVGQGKALERAQTSFLRRMLGLMDVPGRPGVKSKNIRYRSAVRICRALDIYPMDVGL